MGCHRMEVHVLSVQPSFFNNSFWDYENKRFVNWTKIQTLARNLMKNKIKKESLLGTKKLSVFCLFGLERSFLSQPKFILRSMAFLIGTNGKISFPILRPLYHHPTMPSHILVLSQTRQCLCQLEYGNHSAVINLKSMKKGWENIKRNFVF